MRVVKFSNGVRKMSGQMTILKDHDLGLCRLTSYTSLILEVDTDGRLLFLGHNFDCSVTTARHVNKFLSEVDLFINGTRIHNKQQLQKLVKDNVIKVGHLYKY